TSVPRPRQRRASDHFHAGWCSHRGRGAALRHQRGADLSQRLRQEEVASRQTGSARSRLSDQIADTPLGLTPLRLYAVYAAPKLDYSYADDSTEPDHQMAD